MPAMLTQIQHLIGKEWIQLFKARQKDLKLNKNLELQFSRFLSLIEEQQKNKLVLREQGYGKLSCKAIGRILKDNTTLVTLDLSMNSLSLGLDYLISGLRQNETIVCLKIRNNNIDGRKFQKQLFTLVHNHPSLTALDLGNSENIKNRNRIYDEGLQALVDGMTSSKTGFCLISELHLQSACISGQGLQVLQHLQQTKIDLQILDLAFNDLGNEAAHHL